MIYSHSGNLGDIIWSLPTIKHFGPGELNLILGGIPSAIRKYNNGPVFPEYEGRLSQADFDLIGPLLEAQPYITKVLPSDGKTPLGIDLDLFRGTVGQQFKADFLTTFAQTFGIPIDEHLYDPWLIVEPNHIADFVVTRTSRYHSRKTSTIPTWMTLLRANTTSKNGVFIGLPHEHRAFEELYNIDIPYYQCRDFLDMAQVIAGATHFIGNQTFAYSLAIGLGVPTILETRSDVPREMNECYIPRFDCYYF